MCSVFILAYLGSFFQKIVEILPNLSKSPNVPRFHLASFYIILHHYHRPAWKLSADKTPTKPKTRKIPNQPRKRNNSQTETKEMKQPENYFELILSNSFWFFQIPSDSFELFQILSNSSKFPQIT